MKATVIVKFVDNKIRQGISDKKSINEIIGILEERIRIAKEPAVIVDDSNVEHVEKMGVFKQYLVEFSQKRIEDIRFLTSKKEFNHIPKYKLLTLIHFKDRLDGLDDNIEII